MMKMVTLKKKKRRNCTSFILQLLLMKTNCAMAMFGW
jgi:hypothetical protein